MENTDTVKDLLNIMRRKTEIVTFMYAINQGNVDTEYSPNIFLSNDCNYSGTKGTKFWDNTDTTQLRDIKDHTLYIHHCKAGDC